jgi:hypothetical protein
VRLHVARVHAGRPVERRHGVLGPPQQAEAQPDEVVHVREARLTAHHLLEVLERGEEGVTGVRLPAACDQLLGGELLRHEFSGKRQIREKIDPLPDAGKPSAGLRPCGSARP